MYKKILVPLDGSTLGEAVLPHVTALAERFGSEVILMHVMPHSVLANYAETATRWQFKNRDEAGERYLDRLAQPLRQLGLKVSTSVFEGPVAGTILEQAKDMKVDLIAMMTHGAFGIEGIPFSGVAGGVLRHATAPLLLVKSDLAV